MDALNNDQEKTFEQQATAFAGGLVNLLTAVTPVFLIITIVGIATLNGYLEYLHYSKVIGAVAWVPGFIFASIRFGSGLGGIHLFKAGEWIRGGFFVLVSVGLTFWASAHAGSMAESIAVATGQVYNAKVMILTGLWVALLGELMIATYMGRNRNEPQRNDETPQQPGNRNAPATAQHVVSNGNRNGATQPQHGNRNDAILNVAEGVATPPQRQQIGFKRNAANAVTNGVSAKLQDDSYLVAEELDKARNNLRAYESKLRNGKGNLATLQRGVQRWKQKVATLEQQLQEIE